MTSRKKPATIPVDNNILFRTFLRDKASEIQKEATRQHKKYLGGGRFRTEVMDKYQKSHTQIVYALADNLDKEHVPRGTELFRSIGETLAQEAVQDGLTIEEAIDGTIFLKQAVWKKMKDNGILTELSIRQFYEISQIIGTYCDILASKLAFTYHKEMQYIEGNLRYLAEASKILSSSLDYETTLHTIASLAVPHIADWCSVELLANGQLHQVAVAHKDPKRVEWAKELRKKRPPDMDAPMGLPHVLRTGKSELYPIITEEMLKTALKNPKEDMKLIRKIGGFHSVSLSRFFLKKNQLVVSHL